MKKGSETKIIKRSQINLILVIRRYIPMQTSNSRKLT